MHPAEKVTGSITVYHYFFSLILSKETLIRILTFLAWLSEAMYSKCRILNRQMTEHIGDKLVINFTKTTKSM